MKSRYRHFLTARQQKPPRNGLEKFRSVDRRAVEDMESFTGNPVRGWPGKMNTMAPPEYLYKQQESSKTRKITDFRDVDV